MTEIKEINPIERGKYAVVVRILSYNCPDCGKEMSKEVVGSANFFDHCTECNNEFHVIEQQRLNINSKQAK